MSWTEDYEMIAAMRQYGGGFVRALATCFDRADAANAARLKAAFPEYCERYRAIAAEKRGYPRAV